MYFLEQIKTQFMSNIMNYGNLDGPSEVTTPVNPVEGPRGPDDVIRELQATGNEANETAEAMGARGAEFQAGVDGLQGGDGNSEVLGDDGNDTMSEQNEAPSEHLDSVGTASMDDVAAIAERNRMPGAGDEEPPAGEDGEEAPIEQPSPEEVARRTASLQSDRARTQDRINSSPEGSPEKQAAQQEMSAIRMLLNILEYGSINPPSGAVDSAGNPIEGGNSYGGGIGQPLSAEMLAEYGGTGHELASWLQQSGYPVFEGQPNYCGKNVGEAMNAFGYQGLPNHGRNGADWKTICEARPSQFKKIDCRPEDAPAGALISYARNTGGSEARQASGHIEICLGEGRGYYYGAVASQPGGSQKPPQEGSYTIFMPTSKHQRSVA